MTFGPCVHEKELTGLLALGHYPHACPPELRDHVSACRSCSELALVTRAFQTARAQTAAAANLASPGLLWWRAQLRRRNEAVERVGKPILGAYVFALALTVVVASVFAVTQARHGLRWLDWLGQSSSAAFDSLSPSAWLSSGVTLMVLIPIFATVALLGAVAVYLATEKQ